MPLPAFRCPELNHRAHTFIESDATKRAVVVNRFVEGDLDFNSFNNLAFHPGTGNLYVIKDHLNDDIFACLTAPTAISRPMVA